MTTGGFGFKASDRAAGAGTATNFCRQVTAQASGLRVLAAQQFTRDHRRTADPRAQRDHHDIVATSCCPGVTFAE